MHHLNQAVLYSKEEWTGERVRKQHTCSLLLCSELGVGQREDVQQHIDALALYEDVAEVRLLGQAREGHGRALLDGDVGREQGVHDLVEHLALDALLQPLERLLYAVLAGLHLREERRRIEPERGWGM